MESATSLGKVRSAQPMNRKVLEFEQVSHGTSRKCLPSHGRMVGARQRLLSKPYEATWFSCSRNKAFLPTTLDIASHSSVAAHSEPRTVNVLIQRSAQSAMDMSTSSMSMSPTSTMSGMSMASSTSSSMSSMMGMDMMAMTFFTSSTTPLYSMSWMPDSIGQYAGTCIFLIILATVFRAVLALRIHVYPFLNAVEVHRNGGLEYKPYRHGKSSKYPWRAREAVVIGLIDVIIAGLAYLL